MAPFGPQQLDQAPPSPVQDPAAASNTSKLGMLTGGAPPGAAPQAPGAPPGPGGPMPPGGGGIPGGGPGGGNDVSGVLMLGQKLDEAILSLAQVMPGQAGQLDQARELVANAVAQFLQNNPGMGGTAPGGSVTQAGNQYPGGGFGAGRVA